MRLPQKLLRSESEVRDWKLKCVLGTRPEGDLTCRLYEI